MKDYSIDIEDGGKTVAFIVYFNKGADNVVLRGSPKAMREVRDELTRAIVCAEVWSGSDAESVTATRCEEATDD